MFEYTRYPNTIELDTSRPIANKYNFHIACSSLSNVAPQEVSFVNLIEDLRNDSYENKASAMLQSYMDLVSAELTSEEGKGRVKESFYIVYRGLDKLSLDVFNVDIDYQEECLYIYGRKKDTDFYYNFYVEDNNVEATVIVFTPEGQKIIDDNVSNCLSGLLGILQHSETYE